MKNFTKKELIGVIVILLIVGTFTSFGLIGSLRRARDAQRMSDLSAISDGVFSFYEEYGFFPPEENGGIKACKSENFEDVLQQLQSLPQFDRTLFISGLRVCDWGKDALADVVDDSRKPYIAIIPQDPKTDTGLMYRYFSNGNRFQVFAHLEGEDGDEFFDPNVAHRNLACGNAKCNVGKAYADTPLTISIEEYESSLLKK